MNEEIDGVLYWKADGEIIKVRNFIVNLKESQVRSELKGDQWKTFRRFLKFTVGIKPLKSFFDLFRAKGE